MTARERPAGGRGARTTAFTVGGVEYLVGGRVPRILPARRPLLRRCEHAGREFPVVDLPAVLGAGALPGGEPLLLLVEQEQAGGREGDAVRRALVVDELVGTEDLDPEALLPVPPAYPEPERRRWQGLVARTDGRLAVVLRLAGLPADGADSAAGDAGDAGGGG